MGKANDTCKENIKAESTPKTDIFRQKSQSRKFSEWAQS